MPIPSGWAQDVLRNPTLRANMRARGEKIKGVAERFAGAELNHHNSSPVDYHSGFVVIDPVVRGNTLVVVIGNDAAHASYIEHGTRPHIIRPKDPTGFLVFNWTKGFKASAAVTGTGSTVFLKKVNHPGTRPYEILLRALRAGNT